ncbi:hypothetical protein [Chroococcus sp. FPU101]|uniref:hypothetical protein n=1 Tax=Chroococcus sp. FPU101 TaxID=1974212 RepID=UPI001A8C93D0|nr:hypothetical protein [Chroococcus sp. FPU101]
MLIEHQKNLLPLPEIEQPYHYEFTGCTNPFLLVMLASHQGCIYRSDSAIFVERVCVIHWVIKLRFNSKYKLPMNREVANFYKPAGILYSDILRASERLHSFTGDEYQNAAHWFRLILCEQRLGGLNLGTKTNILRGIRKDNQLLSKYQNPFEEEFPHTKRLFDLLLAKSELHDIIRKEVLEPIKKSRKAYATDYHRNGECQPCTFIQGKEYRQMSGSGSGRHELQILCTFEQLQKEMISRNLI